jgi:decaprenyl-phosphate phosphoribosyltransferase
VIALIKLVRLKHWIKNTFIFIPTFFAGKIFDLTELTQLLEGFFAFSFIASAVYILNDINDRNIDRLHPKKKYRPIASGKIKVSQATFIMTLFLISGFTLGFFIAHTFLYLLVGYFLLNVMYSFGLKNIAILDLFIVASGFLLRVYGGGIITNLSISHWLSIMILLLALFLVIAKRRDDLVIHSSTGEEVRRTSKTYNLEFINSCLTLLSAVIIVAYIMYTISPEITERFNSNYLFITTAFVIAGVMRYLQITFVEQQSGSPTSIFFKDRFILITVAGWIISFYILIYAK